MPTLAAARPRPHAVPRRLRCAPRCAATPPPPLPPRRKLVGLGSAGIDFLAAVEAYPPPDAKIRTTQLEVQGGGNCANALTAAARLGLQPVLLFSKIGGDSNGDAIVAQLQADGVDTSALLRQAGAASPFTYIIVDQAASTRTCIHTPGPPCAAEELSDAAIASLLADAALVFFDGRLAECGERLAAAAAAASVPVLCEAERLRPGLEALLHAADVVVASASFPAAWTGHTSVPGALVEMAARLPRARLIVATQGAAGCIALERVEAEAGLCTGSDSDVAEPSAVVAALREEAKRAATSLPLPDALPTPRDAVASPPLRLRRAPPPPPAALAAAATAAAAANGDAANALRYAATHGSGSGGKGGEGSDNVVTARLLHAPAAATSRVVDTTGAGDAFIGAMCYARVAGLRTEAALRLAAWVAATKCRALGPRPGLPRRDEVPPHLLAP